MCSCPPCFCFAPPPYTTRHPPLPRPPPCPSANTILRFFLSTNHTKFKMLNAACILLSMTICKIKIIASTFWPSGSRRWIQIPLYSDAWVRTLQPSCCACNTVPMRSYVFQPDVVFACCALTLWVFPNVGCFFNM